MDNNIKLENISPQQSANFLSKLTFAWLTPLCYKGTKKTLKINDLYETVPADTSGTLGDLLERNWAVELQIGKRKNVKPSLIRAIRKTFFWSYTLCGMVQFFQTVFIRPIQPILLSIFINLFSKNDSTPQRDKDMYLYGGLITLASLVLILLQHHASLMVSRVGMRVRIACCSLVYRKMLKLSQRSANETAAGQIVNLLSNDVSRFDLLAPMLHFLWIMPIQASLITYFVWAEVQTAAFIGVASLAILTVPVHAYVGKLSSALRLRIAKRTDGRVRKMAEIISGIQVIKMYAWEKPFARIVDIARKKEIDILTYASYIRGVMLSSFVFIERFTLFITIISYVLLGNIITANKVFSLAQFFNQLQLTMAIMYPMAMNLGAETLITVRRLEDFLMLDEKSVSKIEKNVDKGILLKNVNASWTNENNVLSNITISLPPGCLCAVVGPVGAGKSSLLQLLLGELELKGGTISMNGKISFDAQEAWLFASTVRKNILFGQTYDRERYKQVVKVCALERDFELFPHGDKTMVGDRGVSLSGGQKARINLARAIYREADIYLLDDPLSAVDTHVGKHLFDVCIYGHLKNKTRILITHQLQYLKKVDHVVVINNGTIEVQGSFAQISESNVDFAKLLTSSANESDAETKEAVLYPVKVSRQESILSSLSILSNKSENVELVPEADEEQVVVQNSSAYWAYWRSGGSICALLSLLIALIMAQAVTNCIDLWLTFWTQQESQHLTCEEYVLLDQNSFLNNSLYYYELEKGTALPVNQDCNDPLSTNTAIYVYLGLMLASIVLLSGRSLYFFKVAMNSSKNLHNKMFECLLLAPMRFYDVNPSGRILNRFSRDMGMIDEILPRIMLEALQIFLVMCGILVMVFIANVYMIAIAAVLAILFYIIRGWYVAVARVIKHLEGITRSPVFSHLTASLNGIATVRAYNAEHILKQEFDVHQDTHTSSWYLMLICIAAFGLWLDFLSWIFVGCVTFGFIIMFQFGSVDDSMVGLAISQSLILTGMVQFGMRQAAEVVSQMTSVERVLEYTTLAKEEPQKTQKDKIPPEPWPHSGAIEFDHVYLQYAAIDPPVLKDLSFNIEAGEKIGIVGRTGAGKSSLISALFRLAPINGTIAIDDIDTSFIGLNELRRKISIIPQEPVLFSATLRYNLDPFSEFHDENLWNALAEVELKDNVESLDMIVQERGTNFSIGQRQLLCLARAILRNNKIMVLDEATANVDPKTDTLIQQTIRNKFKDCTVLTIAHRLHTIIDCDKVLVMDGGCCVEYDHPYILLQNEEGVLRTMVLQTGATAIQLHDAAKTCFLKSIQEEADS